MTTLHDWTFHEYPCRTQSASCNGYEVAITTDNGDGDPSHAAMFDGTSVIVVPSEVLFELVRRIGYDVTKRGAK